MIRKGKREGEGDSSFLPPSRKESESIGDIGPSSPLHCYNFPERKKRRRR